MLPAGAASGACVQGLVACGVDTIDEVPATRWDIASQPALPESFASRARHGGFVKGAEYVDNAAFTISRAEAAAMDPQQRVLLECGYGALHDADVRRAALSSSLTGVFLGISAAEFAGLLAALPAGSSVYAATGTSLSVAAGRLSYVLGLHGPSISYDTACSAALVACQP